MDLNVRHLPSCDTKVTFGLYNIFSVTSSFVRSCLKLIFKFVLRQYPPPPPPPMQNFIEIHQRNPELLSSGRFRPLPPPPPRLDRGIERPRLDRVKTILYCHNLMSKIYGILGGSLCRLFIFFPRMDLNVRHLPSCDTKVTFGLYNIFCPHK